MGDFDSASLSTVLDLSLLTAKVQQALRASAFHNSPSISPRRTREAGEWIVEGFVQYYESPDDTEVNVQGRRLAHEGVGSRSILIAAEVLVRTCFEHTEPSHYVGQKAGSFCVALLEGYIAERENMLLEIQERTHRAYLVARAQQPGESGSSSPGE